MKQRIKLERGDCREVLPQLMESGFLADAIVTDPPSGIGFMGKEWDKDKGGRDHWIAWMQEIAAAGLRCVRPGAHALVWALPRTSHWTATAWENAGWTVRERVSHIFGTGFPKSLNVSKAIDWAVGSRDTITAPATPEAVQWDGWGTALKPAMEDWWLLRAPMSEKTVAANVLAHGTGALNIDASRVDAPDANLSAIQKCQTAQGGHTVTLNMPGHSQPTYNAYGRWPANVIHDGSDEVEAAFARFPTHSAGAARDKLVTTDYNATSYNMSGTVNMRRIGDGGGSPSRFFYSGKASARDRADSKHPTVKPLALMRYLCKLVTPPGGTILDPFAGSGTTLQAAAECGFNAVGIEMTPEYQADIARRIARMKARS